jgi:glucose-1-phosphate thymidylyltransferase
MKGIILAGGLGTRLYPATQTISKQLLPIYDKPMIYYPLSILMLADIRDILIISTPEHTPLFKNLLKCGKQWGLQIEYKVQESPSGLPEAFVLGETFIGNDSVCLILGDNIFYGDSLTQSLQKCSKIKTGCTIFGYPVQDPERYGVVEIKDNKAFSLEEKPKNPKSNCAITGIYFCDNQAVKLSKNLKASQRGETEIIDLLRKYLEQDQLNVEIFGRGTAWLDTGTHTSMLQASVFIETIETRQGLKIACLEEIAYNKGWVDAAIVEHHLEGLEKTPYYHYVQNCIKE